MNWLELKARQKMIRQEEKAPREAGFKKQTILRDPSTAKGSAE